MIGPLRVLLGAACLCAGLQASPALAKRAVYAVAIGNNQAPASDAALPELRYADDDAVRDFELFRRAGKHAKLLTVLDPASLRRHSALSRELLPPTLNDLRRVLHDFQTAMQRDRQRGDKPVLFFTYSGHGAVDDQGRYFLSFLDGGLTQQLLYDDILAAFPNTEVHLIIDACNAEGVVGTRGPFARESEAEVVPLTEQQSRSLVESRSLSRFPLVGALVATSSGEETHEWSQIEAGIFTHEVVSALLGAADVNGDMRIEYSEVEAFVLAANQAVKDPRAVPRVLSQPPAADPHAVLTDLGELDHTRFLSGSAAELGRFSLSLPDGRRLIDAHLDGAAQVVLALPDQPGMYAEQGEREAELPSHGTALSFAELSFGRKRVDARGSLDRTLRNDLWSGAFSVDYYRGVVDSHGLAGVDFSQPARTPLASGPRDEAAGPPSWAGPVLLATSGVALATAIVSFVLAADAKDDFNDTDLQRKAQALSDRYRTLLTVGTVAAVAGAGSGVAAWIVWPRKNHGDAAAGVQLRGRF